eukprot:3047881-Rhodomonas_salina.5
MMLRGCYATSSTEIAFGATRTERGSTCAVLTSGMVLLACYAMCGTELGPMCGTDIACGGTRQPSTVGVTCSCSGKLRPPVQVLPSYARAMRCPVLTSCLVLAAYARAMRCPVLT